MFILPLYVSLLTALIYSHTSFHGLLRRLVIKEATDNISIRDSMVVTEDGIFEVIGKDSNPWNAHPVKVLPLQLNIGINLPWGLVGYHM